MSCVRCGLYTVYDGWTSKRKKIASTRRSWLPGRHTLRGVKCLCDIIHVLTRTNQCWTPQLLLFISFQFFLCYVWVVCVNYCSNSKSSFPQMRFVSRHRFTPQLCLHKSMPWLTNYNKGKNDVQHDAQPIPVWTTHGFYQRLVCCFYQRFFHFAELWRHFYHTAGASEALLRSSTRNEFWLCLAAEFDWRKDFWIEQIWARHHWPKAMFGSLEEGGVLIFCHCLAFCGAEGKMAYN